MCLDCTGVYGLHRPALKCTHFTIFSCFFQGQRKVASREALWGGLLRIFEDFLRFWGFLGEPIWHHFLLKMAPGADSIKSQFLEGPAAEGGRRGVNTPTPACRINW